MQARSTILVGMALASPLLLAATLVAKPTQIQVTASTPPPTSFPQNPALTSLPANTAKEFGVLDCVTPEGEGANYCRKIVDYSGMVYDSKRHQFLMFGGGHSASFVDSVLKLDIATMKWSPLYNPTPCSAMVSSNLDSSLQAWKSVSGGPAPRPVSTHTYDLLGVFEDDFVLASTSTGGTMNQSCPGVSNEAVNQPGRIALFNLNTKTWRFTNSERLYRGFPGMELDPKSRRFIAVGRDGAWQIDPANNYLNSQLPITTNANAFEATLIYFPPTDRFYLIGGPWDATAVSVFEVNYNRDTPSATTVKPVSTTGSPPQNRMGFAYDSKNQVIGGGISGTQFYVFNPATRAWSSQAMVSGRRIATNSFALGYNPVDNVFVYISDDDNDCEFCYRTMAYRYK